MSSRVNSTIGTGIIRLLIRWMTVRRPEVSRRSVCDTSPLMITWQSSPMRVRNILISEVVVFCASSRITRQFLKVRPRITSKGTISMSPVLSAISKAAWPMRSFIASVRGATQGAILSSRVPGKKPRERPEGTFGRVITTLAMRRWRS